MTARSGKLARLKAQIIYLTYQRWSLGSYYIFVGVLVLTVGFIVSDEILRLFGWTGFFLHLTMVIWLLFSGRGRATMLAHSKRKPGSMTLKYIRIGPAIFAAGFVVTAIPWSPWLKFAGFLIMIFSVASYASAALNLRAKGGALVPGQMNYNYYVCPKCSVELRFDDMPGVFGKSFLCPSCRSELRHNELFVELAKGR